MPVLITPRTAAATSAAIDINIQKPIHKAVFDQGNFTIGTTF